MFFSPSLLIIHSVSFSDNCVPQGMGGKRVQGVALCAQRSCRSFFVIMMESEDEIIRAVSDHLVMALPRITLSNYIQQDTAVN